jgi:hypothetical protein
MSSLAPSVTTVPAVSVEERPARHSKSVVLAGAIGTDQAKDSRPGRTSNGHIIEGQNDDRSAS